MLTTKMYERIAEDRRSLTLDLASGVGIGMGGERAYRAWLASQGTPSSDAVASQRATIGRLAEMFPGAVQKRPD